MKPDGFCTKFGPNRSREECITDPVSTIDLSLDS